MKFSLSQLSPVEAEASWILIGITEDGEFDEAVQSLDEALSGSLTRMKEREDLTGKSGELTIIPDAPHLNADRLIIAGLGKSDKLKIGGFGKSIVTAIRKIASKEDQTLSVCVPVSASKAFSEESALERIADVVTVGCSTQGLYKEEQDRHEFTAVTILGAEETKQNQDAIARGCILGEAVNLTRKLVNQHPDDLYPDSFAQISADEAAAIGIRGEILDEHMLDDENMGALLAVSKGTDRPPRMVVLRYEGGGEGIPTLALVGKGVTFDSGGLSLKPSAGMITMKSDMAGAATVLGAITAIAKLKLPVNVTGYMGLVENMTGAGAYKLGSVVTARNGKTIEIHNTDAEGRLVLADVLAYAVDHKVDKIVDLATLTGACVVALGEDVVGAFSNNQPWCESVLNSSREVGEDIWQMPMYDYFAEQLKSEFADCKNIGSRWGGAITAAKFLEQFVDETPWVHLDIAGPSYAESKSAHQDAGGTGVMVRALVRLAMEN